MTASVYVPLWVPAAIICAACLSPDLVKLPGRYFAWRRHKRLLARLWDEREYERDAA